MARHRNVRGYNYNEDFEEDDLYGHSVEDDYCISPSTAAQFIYSRRDNPSALTEALEEEYGYEDKEHSNCISSHELTEVEKAQLEPCLKHMKEVLGESVPEQVIVEAVLNSKFNVQQALDSLLAQGNNQNMKTKDKVTGGKAAKGLFCSEIYSSDHRLSDLVENTSDSTTTCFNLSDPIVRFGPSDASDEILPRSKYVKIPSVKKQTLTSSCKYLGVPPLPVSDNDIVFHDSVNKQASLPLVGDSRTTTWRSVNESGFLSSSRDEVVVKDNSSERAFWNQSEYEDIQDLKTLVRLNETGDSADTQDIASVFLQKKSDDSKSCLDSPPGLISALGDMMLHKKMKNKFTGKIGHFENVCSVSQNKSSSQGHNCSFSVFDSLTLPLSESPSLADILQEHQSSNSDKMYPLSDQFNPPVAGFIDMELGYSPLSQLAGLPQISSGMAELSGSLSSLTFSRSSPVKELESLSLSDLIANSIEVAKPAAVSHSELNADKMMQPPGVNSDIDLSVLIRKSTLSEHAEEKSERQLPETGVSCPVQEQQILVAKGVKKSKKRVRSHILEGPLPWTKTLSARPSAFAITLCLHYPPKRCKHGTVSLHEAFLYSRQMQEVKINETGPLLTITPFDFKSPSPDDIVKAGQKKAFTR